MLGFLRKVYGILSAQLALTVVIAGICIAVPPVRAFVHARYVCPGHMMWSPIGVCM